MTMIDSILPELDEIEPVRNRVRDPSEYLRLGMTEYPLPGFLSVFGSCAGGVAGEY